MTDRPADHPIKCLQIWGGNRAIDSAISTPGVDLYLRSRVHDGDAAGGDIHYVSACAAGKVSRFVLADVAGHGSDAASFAAGLRRLMRKHINTPDQSRLARSLNDDLFAGADARARFATALLATYFAPTDHLILCNAGHPRPALRRAGAGAWSILTHDDYSPDVIARGDGPANLPLGVIEPTEYHQFALPLEPGDLVLMYTDAVTESRDASGHMLGEAGLLDILRSLDADRPETLLDAIESRLDDRSPGPPDDDRTILLLAHTASDPGPKPIGERVAMLGRLLGVTPDDAGDPSKPAPAPA